MVKWWMRCICNELEVTSPRPLRTPANTTAEKQQFLSREAVTPHAGRTYFHVSNINQLQELLEEIDKAIDRARKRTSWRDGVSKTIVCNVNDAEAVLNEVTQFCQGFNNSQTPVVKVANESYKVLCDLLEGVGNLHWAAAGVSMVAFVLNRVDLVGTNAVECLYLLEIMRDLGKHVVSLYPQLSEKDERLRRAICLITEGSTLCCHHMKSGIWTRFGFASVNRDDFLKLRDQITLLYPDMALTVAETMLERTAVLLRQSTMPLSPLKPEYPANKVGLDEKVDAVLQILGMGILQGQQAGVRAVVLHGMGGIGKSTLGMALHAKLPFKGRNHSKVEIGENPTSEKIRDCQRDILSRLSGQKMAIGDFSEGQQKLDSYFSDCSAPTLLVIDNIFKAEDLEKLLPDNLALPEGSCIIVTSRDASVCAVLEEKGIACQPYPVEELGQSQARELLCMQVFNGRPPPTNRERLVDDLLNICGGLPLALEVVGRYLRRHKSSDKAWNLAIESLHKCRPVSGKKEDQLYQSLMFSYDQLAEDYQKAFLDITCLLGDTPWDWVEPVYGEKLVTLEELALVKKIDGGDGFVRLQVHDLLVALGRSINIGTRVWSDGQDQLPPLLQDDDMGICASVEGLYVRNCSVPIHAEKLDAMHRSLRVLILQDVPVLGRCSKTPHGLQICITTNGVPYKDLAKLNALQVLIMAHETDFEFESAEFPRHLKVLILVEVSSLKRLPTAFGELSSLQTLEIQWCKSVEELPEDFCQLQCLRTLILLGCEKLKELPRNFERLQSLQILDLCYCEQLQELPTGFGQLVDLQRLNLCGCKSLKKLPDGFFQLRSLEALHLGQCESLETLPEDFGRLGALQDLNLTRCKSLVRLPEGFENLGALRTLSLEHCHKLSMLPTDFGHLHSLATLRLSNCHCVEKLPTSFLDLRHLSSLDVSGCPLVNMDLLEELKQQQECRVVCENISWEDMEYLESTDHDSALSLYYGSTEEEQDFEYNDYTEYNAMYS